MKLLKPSEIMEVLSLLKEHVEEIRRLSMVTVPNEETMRTIYRHARDILEIIDEFEERMGLYGRW
jgi:transcriptional/translational regulatory protein YebC/TACO1